MLWEHGHIGSLANLIDPHDASLSSDDEGERDLLAKTPSCRKAKTLAALRHPFGNKPDSGIVLKFRCGYNRRGYMLWEHGSIGSLVNLIEPRRANATRW